MPEALTIALLFAGVLIFLASLDDLAVDILVFFKLRGARIKQFSSSNMLVQRKPQIRIFVANWHEADVLANMVEGNIKNITYGPVKFVLGVYPNDIETRRVAESLVRKHPRSVEMVVNRRSGPTSKGQMLNEMFACVFEKLERNPDLVILHDSEDVISPRALDVYASHASHHAMIQLPVLSLDSRERSMVAATYMEEFAERHTREMVLRDRLGAFVPSAGVGTCLRKDLILHFLRKRGYVFQPSSVTEDYILGAEAHREGFKTTFLAFRDQKSPDNPLIATLEYFPKEFWASITQRTRWVYGISFDGARRLGWSRSWWDCFFLYRDRKGAIANLLPFASLILLVLCLLIGVDTEQLSPWQKSLLWLVLGINTFNIGVRYYFKASALREIYGTYDLLGLILRWPVVTTINAFATTRAWRSYVLESRWASRPIAWAKTRHEIPAAFEFLAATTSTPVVEVAPSTAILKRWPRVSRRLVMNGLVTACYAAAVGVAGGYWYQRLTPSPAKYELAPSGTIHSLMTTALPDEGADTLRDERAYGHERAVAAIKRSADEDNKILERIAARQPAPSGITAVADDGADTTLRDERAYGHERAVAAIKRSADEDNKILERIAARQPAPSGITALPNDGAETLRDEITDAHERAVAAIKRSADEDKKILERIGARQSAPTETTALPDDGAETPN